MIDTQRLTLRPLTPANAVEVHEYQSNPDAVRYVPFATRNLDEVTAALQRQTSHPALAEVGEFVIFGAWSKLDGGLVGQFNIGLDKLDPKTGNFGYLVDPKRWGDGYAFEATTAVLNWAFGTHKFARVTAIIDVRNLASINLAEKLGMRREATHVDHDRLKGELVSEHVYAILVREWRSGLFADADDANG